MCFNRFKAADACKRDNVLSYLPSLWRLLKYICLRSDCVRPVSSGATSAHRVCRGILVLVTFRENRALPRHWLSSTVVLSARWRPSFFALSLLVALTMLWLLRAGDFRSFINCFSLMKANSFNLVERTVGVTV